MRRTVLTAIAAAVLVTLASAASAAPDRSVVLSSDSPTASWTSRVNVGAHVGYSDFTKDLRCITPCDQTLIRVSTPGTLRVVAKKGGPLSSNDFYVLVPSIHRSDANGSELAPIRTQQLHSRDSESLTTGSLRPGFYLFKVESREGVGYYEGTATLIPATKR